MEQEEQREKEKTIIWGRERERKMVMWQRGRKCLHAEGQEKNRYEADLENQKLLADQKSHRLETEMQKLRLSLWADQGLRRQIEQDKMKVEMEIKLQEIE